MMNAPALPAAPGAMPAGFASFLANIGQVSPDGDAAAFGRLLAAAPAAGEPAASAATTAPTAATMAAAMAMAVAPPQAPMPVEAEADGQPVPAEAGDAGDAPGAPATRRPAARVDASPVEARSRHGDAAAHAATLLVALSGARPGPAHGANKPTDADAAPDAGHPGGAPAAPAVENWATIVAAVPPDTARAGEPRAAKPESARPHAAAPGINTPGAAPDKAAADMRGPPPGTLAVASPSTRDAVMPALPLAADPPVARVAEAAPAMTVLFTQTAALTAAAPFDAAAPATIAERVLDMDSDGAWIDQLARDIAATGSDSGDISFRLMPRHLGRLDVAMRMEGEGVALKMDTQHEATATIVAAAQGRLVDELRQQGVRVAGTEVTHTPGETGRQSQGQSQGRAATPDTAHLIETATERAEPRNEARAADRRGRFA